MSIVMFKMLKLDAMMWLVINEKNITQILLIWEIIHHNEYLMAQKLKHH
jgi:hypothetical protein